MKIASGNPMPCYIYTIKLLCIDHFRDPFRWPQVFSLITKELHCDATNNEETYQIHFTVVSFLITVIWHVSSTETKATQQNIFYLKRCKRWNLKCANYWYTSVQFCVCRHHYQSLTTVFIRISTQPRISAHLE